MINSFQILHADFINIKDGYPQINFKKFITRIMPRINWYCDFDKIDIGLCRQFPKEYRDIKKEFFLKHGYSATLHIEQLLFFQEYVGVNGPQYHTLNDPVYVVHCNDGYVLWEGYHRIFQKILSGVINIDAKILEIPI